MSFRKGRGGQALVETAVLLPILFIFLIGIVDFGILFHNYLVLTYSVREAARWAAMGASDDQIKLVIYNSMESFMTSFFLIGKMGGAITIKPDAATRSSADYIGKAVRVGIPFKFYINLPYLMETSIITTDVSCVMRLQKKTT